MEKKREKEKSVGRDLKGMRGLVIDDELTILDLISKYLKHLGCEIVTACDAKTALNIVESKNFDFIICDIKMQGLGGADFYRIIKEKKPLITNRIIFSTGDILSETTKAFIDSVTNPYIEKPFNLNGLKEVIINMISDGNK